MANPSLQIGNSNWAIKEDDLLGYSTAGTNYLPKPMTMTRESAGTRVNSQGLVETVELLGSEEVTNGNFDTDTDWVKEGTWTISNGTANRTAQASGFELKQTFSVFNSNTWKVSFEIISISNGGCGFRLNGGSVNTYYTEVGVYTETIIASGAASDVIIQANSTFAGSIDNVTVKEVIKNNLARVDYDGTASSLLVEPERTNLITYSEELQSTSNVTLSNTISPDGTLNGLKINETTSNSQHYGTSYEASVVSGTIYAVSFYIKKGTYDLVTVYTQSSKIAAQINITFSTESTSATGSDVVSGSNFMEDAGNGWYRVGFSATANSTGGVSIYLPIKDLSSYVGDISQYTEYWGTQIEQGSYATSYIPTDGGTVTRVQDQYSKTGISNLINSTEGVLFAEMAVLSDDSTLKSITLSDGTGGNRVIINYSNASNRLTADVRVGAVGQAFMQTYSYTITNFLKIALKYKENDFALWVNGTEVATDTSGSTFSANTLNRLGLDNGGSGELLFGKLKQLQVFKTALTDDELAALTS